MTEPSEPACPFCPIPVPDAKLVRNWGHVVAFEPLNPVTPGHLLVVPRQHLADFTVSPSLTGHVMYYASQMARMMGDCNLITSKGAAATQTVRHLHVHVVPRRPRDGLHLPWTAV